MKDNEGNDTYFEGVPVIVFIDSEDERFIENSFQNADAQDEGES